MHVKAKIEAVYRYPVKGLSPEKLAEVVLEPGRTLPFDRAYALENGKGRFDPADPRHLPKVNFLMLMRNERLAALETSFDGETQKLSIQKGGQQLAEGRLDTPEGAAAIETFMADYMREELRGAPKLVASPGHSFSDVAAKCVHLINLESLRELEKMAGRALDPLRFRANLLIDGAPAFSELDWIGGHFRAGEARLKAFKRTQRCAATNVDPRTALREGDLPGLLQERLGHADFGIYLMVEEGGRLSSGDAFVTD